MKSCTKCGRSKPVTEFNKHKSAKDGRNSWCKACTNDNRLLRTYGINNDQYLQLLEEQNYACKLCGGQPRRDRFDIDHCHTTGKVRGLLCEHCNRGLGCFKDNPTLLMTAINYLNDSQFPNARTSDIPKQRCSEDVQGKYQGS